MNEEHETGQCHLCRKETMVRWKNIYHRGSEGLTVCQPCENKIVGFVGALSRAAVKSRKDGKKRTVLPHTIEIR